MTLIATGSPPWRPSITLEDGENMFLLIALASRVLKQFIGPEIAAQMQADVRASQSYDDAKAVIDRYCEVNWT